jgi:Na+-transporting methylmalonyl-CoA/oxaloacetate decarboxylase gamma subunit
MGALSPAGWAFILGISCVILVLLMVLILVIHKVTVSNEKWHAKRKSLREQLKKTNNPTPEELEGFKKEIAQLKQEDVLGDVGATFEAVVNSGSGRDLDGFIWHNAVGRVAAQQLKSLFLHIDMVLNTALAFFINSLAGAIIQFYYAGENLITGWTIAILVLLVLMTFFGLVSYHVVRYIDTRLVTPGLYDEKQL